MMKLFGILFALIASVLAVVAFIPLLGWLYWLVIPFGILALILSAIGNSSTGKTLSIIVILVGIFRLMIGGGIF
ncbi:hypothetical protein A8C56_04035 [Niabella ginsenosidivorans]|uniref:Uncharacterized protein n=1 Tax=Niabella ginsenosidivorans TaxID=1176587 RepID=A0A1A9I130_9BACT|nr:hypothetical protein [Niabella ginsenosidivorans]ANH80264.1 hypothetical protein A8C56_04035 [Niabella ginsenosidivorans]